MLDIVVTPAAPSREYSNHAGSVFWGFRLSSRFATTRIRPRLPQPHLRRRRFVVFASDKHTPCKVHPFAVYNSLRIRVTVASSFHLTQSHTSLSRQPEAFTHSLEPATTDQPHAFFFHHPPSSNNHAHSDSGLHRHCRSLWRCHAYFPSLFNHRRYCQYQHEPRCQP